MSLHEIIEEALHLKPQEQYLIIENLIQSLKETSEDETKPIKTDTSHTNAFGILKNSDVDPVVWQQSLRSENDSDAY